MKISLKNFNFLAKGKHQYSTTLIQVPPDQAKQFVDYGKTIPEKDLAAKGRETEPHITILYGTHTNKAKPIEDVISGFGDVEVELGETSIFEQPDYDVLKVEVKSKDLQSLHKLIAKDVPNTKTHPKYNPHLTIAYLKSGKGKTYAGDNRFDGTRIVAGKAHFSNKNGQKKVIMLKGIFFSKSQMSMFDAPPKPKAPRVTGLSFGVKKEQPQIGDTKTENGIQYRFLETTPGKPRWHAPDEIPAGHKPKHEEEPKPETPERKEAKNPKDFPANTKVRSIHSGKEYHVVEPDSHKGMAKLTNLQSGKVEDWNAHNNPHFEEVKDELSTAVNTAIKKEDRKRKPKSKAYMPDADLFTGAKQQESKKEEDFGVSAEISGLRKQREEWNRQALEILAKDKITDEDKKVLAKYSGRGGTDDGSLNEFYTSKELSGWMWDMLKKFGFAGGHVLEPSCGTGVFIHTKPDDTLVTGVELSETSAKIAKILHDNDIIHNSPFEDFVTEENDSLFDAVIGNIPFGVRGAAAGTHKPKIKNNEEYFCDALLDQLVPQGLLALIVPTGVMENKSFMELRRSMCERAEFLSAYRLPNTAFKHAGTSVTTDVLFFRRHPQEALTELEVREKSDPALDAMGLYHREFINGEYFTGSGKNHIWGEVGVGQWGGVAVKGQITGEHLKTALDETIPSTVDYTKVTEWEPMPKREVHVGDIKHVNGRQYRLNENHRWERVESDDEAHERKLNVDFKNIFGVGDREEFHQTLADLSLRLGMDDNQLQVASDYLSVIGEDEFPGSEHLHKTIDAVRNVSRNGATEADQKKLRMAGLLGSEVLALQTQVESGHPIDYTRFEKMILLLEEYSKNYGNPQKDKQLIREGMSAKGIGRLLGAFKNDGTVSDFFLRPESFYQSKTQNLPYREDDVLSILTHFNNEGITGNTRTIARYWTGAKGKKDDEVNALLLQDENVGYSQDHYGPISRYLTGSVYDKIDRWNEEIAELESSKDKQKGLKIAKLNKQIDQLRTKVKYRTVEEIDTPMTARWLPLEVLNEFMAEQGWMGFHYDQERHEYDIDFSSKGEKPDKHNFLGDLIRYMNNQGLQHGSQNKSRMEAIAEFEKQFKSWLAVHSKRDEYEQLYNRTFNNYVKEDYDDSALRIDKIAEGFTLNAYHNSAIRRLVEKGRGILAYDVGLGKTFASIALALYRKQRGEIKKPMAVVPKSVLANWYSEFKTLTAGKDASILVIGMHEQKDKSGNLFKDDEGKVKWIEDGFDEVQAKLQQVAQNEYDLVLITRDKLDMMMLNPNITSEYMEHVVSRHITSMQPDEEEVSEEGGKKRKKGSSKRDIMEAAETVRSSVMGKVKGGHEKILNIYFDQLGVDCMIVDECLPYNAKVMTEAGEMTIGQIVTQRLPVRVYSYNRTTKQIELKPVVNWMEKQLNHRIVKLHLSNGKHLVCTHNHRILTEEGYVPAIYTAGSQVYYGGEELRLVQKSVSVQIKREGQKRQAPVLLNVMRQLLHCITPTYQRPKAETRRSVDESNTRKENAGSLRTNAPAQSDVQSRHYREGAPSIKGETIRESRWKRTADKTSATTLISVKPSNRVHNRNIGSQTSFSLYSKLLQSRYCRPFTQTCNRSGRTFSQSATREGTRPTQNPGLESTWVVRVEILESRDFVRHGFRDSQDTNVYDITVEDNHNFFADRLLVSNCHHYRNLFGLPGRPIRWALPQPDTQRSMRMYMFSKYVRSNNNDRNVYFLTATPTVNNPLEAYNMLQYIAPEEFDSQRINNMQDFFKMFGRVEMVNIPDTSGAMKEVEALVGFKNLPELRQLFMKYTDMRNATDVGLKLPKADYQYKFSDMTPLQKRVYQELRERAAGMLKGTNSENPDEPKDHIFSILSDMQKATISLGLLKTTGSYFAPAITDEELAKDGMSPKMRQYVDEAVTYYKAGKKKLVFLEFKHAQEELKRHLVKAGVPEKDIFIVNAETVGSADKRQRISTDYNSGKYKIVIGNATMREGMNFQKGTAAVSHLMLPWTPAAINQANGRGLRQGNTEEEVAIQYYMTRGSFDQFLHTVIDKKKSWIRDLWQGDSDTASNEGTGRSFSPQEMQIMLSDDPEAERIRFEAENKNALQKQADSYRQRALSGFNQYQNLLIQFGKMTPQERRTPKGKELNSRINTAKHRLSNDQYFEHKGLLEGNEPAYIDAEKRTVIPTGHYFTRTDGDWQKHGIYSFDSVDPVNRTVTLRKVLNGTDNSYHHTNPREIGGTNKVGYGDLRKFFNYGMAPVNVPAEHVEKELLSQVKNWKTVTALKPETIASNKEHIANRIIKEGEYGAKWFPFINKHTGQVDFISGDDIGEKPKSYEARQKVGVDDIYWPIDPERWKRDILEAAFKKKPEEIRSHGRRRGSYNYIPREVEFAQRAIGYDWFHQYKEMKNQPVTEEDEQ